MDAKFKPSLLDRAICAVSPSMGVRRLAARRILHEYRYEGAEASHKRGSAPQNMSPNSFDVQRDRLQLMREAEDLERNFSPAAMLNRKYAMYCAPISYHAQTGDRGLDTAVEDYLAEVFANCDHTERYDFWKMMEFAIMGMNRGGDYGFAFTRPGMWEGISEIDALELPLKIQAIEPDRIGGVYQNVVSNDYVAGLNIGPHGQIESFRVFHRSMTTSMYDDPVDVPAEQFVHITDPLRIDMYRGVSKLATAVQNLRDLYESIDFIKGKMKIASALTVFTNSNGASIGSGTMDPYAVTGPGAGTALQQDINFGQINHLAGGTDIKFPSSSTPSSEEQWVIVQLLKFVAMAYNLPYSFALDASSLGGVSSRLESEMAKAEFERGQGVIKPHATRIKNMFLLDGVAKGHFKVSDLSRITRGRWGFRSHPQPDLGREASAAVNLYQTGLLNPLKYWVENAEDPESVATDMVRWHEIKKNAAASKGFEVTDVFGAGPAKPISATESTTETTDSTGKEMSRKDFGRYDAQIRQITEQNTYIKDRIQWCRDRLAELEKKGPDFSPSLIEKLRKEIDQLATQLEANREMRKRLRNRNSDLPAKPEIERTPEETAERKAKRNDRHALTQALMQQGVPEMEAYAIAYDIIEKGKFKQSKLPAEIQAKYYPK